jgi:hypothetical protein
MAGVGRRTLRSAAAPTIANGNPVLVSTRVRFHHPLMQITERSTMAVVVSPETSPTVSFYSSNPLPNLCAG